MGYIANLKLHNFRCYEQADLEEIPSGLIVLNGPNGAGKTNILEAISLLSPGRGLRGAKIMEIQCSGSKKPWAVSASIQTDYGPVQLGTGADADSGKRIIRINGETMRSQSSLSDHLACVWLTPQMDRLFLDSSAQRRKFLDRLIFAFDPGHSGRELRYKNAMRQRSRLLKEGKIEPAWLQSLESQMAETGVAIAAARLDFISRLQTACNEADNQLFPRSNVYPVGIIEELLQNAPALEVEDLFKSRLLESRGVDMLTGGAAIGVHKSDLVVHYAEKDMLASQCSTGEQKALLIGIIMAHARLIAAERGRPPLLLLDEIAAHLDESRREALYDLLKTLGGQVWLTGTEITLFNSISANAQFFYIHEGQIMRQNQLETVSHS